MPVGVSVTLRRARMYEFLDRLMSVAIPRIRDFRGLSPRSFDGRGNYSMGVREQIIFPEIDYDAIDQVRGLDVTITTSAKTDEEAYALLRELGMPFSREGAPGEDRDAAEEAEEERRKEEARARAEAEQAALEELKEENPEAYEKPAPAEDRGRRGRSRRGTGVDGKDFTAGPPAARVQVQDAELQPLQAVRSPARVPAQVRALPHLPARDRPRGHDPGPHQVELVAMQTDPIADFLTRIRNGLRADHDEVEMPASTFKAELARILDRAGLHRRLRGRARARGPRAAREAQVHRGPQARDPRHRAPVQARPAPATWPPSEVPKVQGGMGTTIVSTSRGVMTGHDARRQGVGGELVARVW